jgi:hypothetical protein
VAKPKETKALGYFQLVYGKEATLTFLFSDLSLERSLSYFIKTLKNLGKN